MSDNERALEQAKRAEAEARAVRMRYEREVITERAENLDAFERMTGAERTALYQQDPELYTRMTDARRADALGKLLRKDGHPWGR